MLSKEVEKQVNTYKRYLELEKVAEAAYVFLIFLSLIIYGVFGLGPLYRIVGEKLTLVKEMTSINQNLATKIEEIKTLKSDYEKILPYISGLKNSLPSNPEEDQVAVMLSRLVSKVGYTQRTFTVIQKIDGTLEVGVVFQGALNQFPELVKEIELAPRLGHILDMTLSYQEETAKVNMTLVFYYTED